MVKHLGGSKEEQCQCTVYRESQYCYSHCPDVRARKRIAEANKYAEKIEISELAYLQNPSKTAKDLKAARIELRLLQDRIGALEVVKRGLEVFVSHAGLMKRLEAIYANANARGDLNAASVALNAMEDSINIIKTQGEKQK